MLLALLSAGLGACQSGPRVPASPAVVGMIQVSMNPGSWFFTHSPGMPLNPITHVDGGWSFDFPQRDGVHGVVYGVSGTAPREVRIIARVEGEGSLVAVDGCTPTRARIFLQRRGDNYTLPSSEADGNLNLTSPTAKENWRWWNEGAPLVPGQGFDVITPLTPDKWIQVWGRSGVTRPAAFADAINNLQRVGITFGACSAMHGVYANGPARFVVKEVSFR